MKQTPSLRLRPKNIVVGQKYRHPGHPGTEYLGVGNVVAEQGPIVKNKQLVIIKCKTDPTMVGRFVNKTGLYPWFWNRFVEA
jgi:hypothetical protein